MARPRSGASRPHPPYLTEVADRLHSAAVHLLRTVRTEDLASGISAAQLSALSVLVLTGPRTLGELAAVEQVKAPTISRLVRGMEAAKLIVRRAEPRDARITIVEATRKGERMLQAGRARRIRALAARLHGASRAELALLTTAAGLLERCLGTSHRSPKTRHAGAGQRTVGGAQGPKRRA